MSEGDVKPQETKFMVALLAGGCAGTSVDVALFPIDTIKTSLQVHALPYYAPLSGAKITPRSSALSRVAPYFTAEQRVVPGSGSARLRQGWWFQGRVQRPCFRRSRIRSGSSTILLVLRDSKECTYQEGRREVAPHPPAFSVRSFTLGRMLLRPKLPAMHVGTTQGAI